MNRNEAKKIAETVSVSDLKQMFLNAQEGVKDWEKVSNVNKGMTKGAAFNILSKGTIDEKTNIMAKLNMVREFGEYLPNYKKEIKVQIDQIKPHHEKPYFIIEEDFLD